jgi:hypothetical protein
VLPKEAEENGLIKAKEPSLPAQVGAGEKARSKKSRARRLSYVDHRDEAQHNDKGQKIAEDDDDEDGEEEEEEASAPLYLTIGQTDRVMYLSAHQPLPETSRDEEVPPLSP